MVHIYPSLLSADFFTLSSTLKEIEPHCEGLHWDVMDGHFAPNLSFGPSIIKCVRPHTRLLFDVHLMVERPLSFINPFIEAGADRICFHIEAKDDAEKVIESVKRRDAQVGLALNPPTPLEKIKHLLGALDCIIIMSVNPGFSGQRFIKESIRKIKEARELVAKERAGCKIEVDGGVEKSNIKEVVEAGAQILVCGSSVFRGDDPLKNLLTLRECV